ncbi:aminotransferase class V-fold PLP-dependent enzyme [uncultured Umboniibacter sp.]|uniref:aminotransferase class V-fold PLP-dependent enzyme n=1 Tax=uncultured Umboniibacter sp. TaxID=1798917 RepID=UPI002627F1F5|nr:aminotransferase class V-fold PLP-dependent enzyme [uncultured Umboniibacter sp.]
MSKPLIEQVRAGVIGETQAISTPFGTRPLIYADYTASGRSLDFVENFIQQRVLPYYANTHSESSLTGRQTTALREEARAAIKQSLNATEEHRLIFCGSGATAAIHKFIGIMGLHEEKAERPVVFIGPYEHHSNDLPWREAPVDLVRIPLCSQGLIDEAELTAQLRKYQKRKLLIGSFSAASNVTGVKTPVKRISALLHKFGALSCWDYAAAGPYVEIDVQNTLASGEGDNSLDAVYLSPHKFIGGPGTPGVLLLKSVLSDNACPTVPGGGTVSFVAAKRHTFLTDIERREEGGTPAIVEAIRAGIVFSIKDQVGASNIVELEHGYLQRAFAVWEQNPSIKILGGTTLDRLGIVSLRFLEGNKDLHYGFVVALLNDLFGIQARGGCSCAGPYGHELLGLSEEQSLAIEAANHRGDMVLRPGWLRLNFNYFIDDETANYLISAVDWVASHGIKLLNHYCYDRSSGTWNYRGERLPLTVSLSDVFGHRSVPNLSPIDKPLNHYIDRADAIVDHCNETTGRGGCRIGDESKDLCWFVRPNEPA